MDDRGFVCPTCGRTHGSPEKPRLDNTDMGAALVIAVPMTFISIGLFGFFIGVGAGMLCGLAWLVFVYKGRERRHV